MKATAADSAQVPHEDMPAIQLELGYQRTASGQAQVTLRGELDIATARQASDYLHAVLDSDKRGQLTINLAGLAFCDAAGLGVLATVARRARRSGRLVKLANPRPALVRIMRITGMDAAFPEVARVPVLQRVPAPRAAG